MNAQSPAISELDTLILGNFNTTGFQAILKDGELVRLPASEGKKIFAVSSGEYLARLEARKLKFQAYGKTRTSGRQNLPEIKSPFILL